jgi:hypothetical protein
LEPQKPVRRFSVWANARFTFFLTEYWVFRAEGKRKSVFLQFGEDFLITHKENEPSIERKRMTANESLS